MLMSERRLRAVIRGVLREGFGDLLARDVDVNAVHQAVQRGRRSVGKQLAILERVLGNYQAILEKGKAGEYRGLGEGDVEQLKLAVGVYWQMLSGREQYRDLEKPEFLKELSDK
jgi:hypothetical protein